MIWFLVILFLAMTIIFLMGKGSSLIAGYNTMGKGRERYDEKKLCRVMGMCMGIITICMAVMAWYGDNAPNVLSQVFMVVIILDVAATMILSNTICKKKDYQIPDDAKESEDDKKASFNRRATRIMIIIVSAIGLLVCVMLVTGNVSVDMNEEGMNIQGSFWADKEVKWESIQSVSYETGITAGRRRNGLGSFRLRERLFENGQFGKYTMYAYVECEEYVVMETDDGILVLNQETAEKTQALYEIIQDKCTAD
ncbi:MAG: DUF3784 domain-containing protein [Clostridia bacterium]|nr:DUF3784 domain-containing protein [Clostridia bacterium]